MIVLTCCKEGIYKYLNINLTLHLLMPFFLEGGGGWSDFTSHPFVLLFVSVSLSLVPCKPEVAQTLNYDGSVRTELLILLIKTKQNDTILDISFIILVSLSKCYTTPKWFPISSHARNDLVKGNPGYYPTKSPAILGPHKETARKQR